MDWNTLTEFEKEMEFELGYADSLTYEEIEEIYKVPPLSKLTNKEQSINSLFTSHRNVKDPYPPKLSDVSFNNQYREKINPDFGASDVATGSSKMKE